MTYSYDFAVIGGDNRQLFLADLLSRQNTRVCYYGLTPCALSSKYIPCFINGTITACSSLKEALTNSQNIIGPTPLCKDTTHVSSSSTIGIELKDFISYCSKDQKIYAGAIPTNVQNRVKDLGLTFIDIMKWEHVSLKNSVATAEGAICEAIKNSVINIQGSKILILGFGRCGQILAKKLAALDAEVSISVRRPEVLSLASAYGYDGFLIDQLQTHIGSYDFIFNTIPCMVLPKDILKYVSEDVVIIDIATYPGGVDFNYTCDHCINAGLYLGLPGRMSPKSSAKIQLEAILNDCMS